MTIPVPTSVSTNTNTVGGLTTTTITIDVDFGSVLIWHKPLTQFSYPWHRRPGGADVAAKASVAPTFAFERKNIPSGSYATLFTRYVPGAASTRVAQPNGDYGTDYTVYIVRSNAAGALARQWYLPIDSAGIAALQPAFGLTIIGLENIGAYPIFEPISPLPSWAVVDPSLQPLAGSSNRGPLTSPTLNPTIYNQYYVGGVLVLSPRDLYSTYLERGYSLLATDPNGKTCHLNSWLEYTTVNPLPTGSVTLKWYDKEGVFISNGPTYGPFTASNSVIRTGSTSGCGICVDFSLGSLTPPSNARSFKLSASYSGIVADLRAPGYPLHMREHEQIFGGLMAPPHVSISRLDQGGFIPGVMVG